MLSADTALLSWPTAVAFAAVAAADWPTAVELEVVAVAFVPTAVVLVPDACEPVPTAVVAVPLTVPPPTAWARASEGATMEIAADETPASSISRTRLVTV